MKNALTTPCAIGLALLVTSGLSFAAGDCAEGCTPGYWKTHTERWDGAGTDDFTQSIQHQLSFNAVLGVVSSQSGVPDTTTLLDAASTGGGDLTALNRHTAAALASADTAIFYPFSVQSVIDLYQDAVGATSGSETVPTAHKTLEFANELGCPLSNSWQPSGICTYCFADGSDCPCGVSDPNGGCTNSTGAGAVLTPSGSGDTGADDLVLNATNLPANKTVIWLMAPAANRHPLRDGLLCLSQGNLKIFRFPVQVSSASGVSTFGPGIVQASIDHGVDAAQIFAGDTWNFQAYYRDSGSPCGNNANTTNAARVNFY